MTVELHRCPLMFIRTKGQGCLNVQKALEEGGIDYELARVRLRRSRRSDIIRMTGQQLVPVMEYEDGTAYREESTDMVDRIRSGRVGLSAAPD